MHRNLESSELGDRLEMQDEGEGGVQDDNLTLSDRENNATDDVCTGCIVSGHI